MLIKKCDVKAHFAARLRKPVLNKNSAGEPDATVFSVTEIDRLGANMANPVVDSGERPTASGQGIPPSV